MAGEYFFAKNKKEAKSLLKSKYPFANKFMVDSAPSLQSKAPKGKSPFYGIADKVDKKGKLMWHN